MNHLSSTTLAQTTRNAGATAYITDDDKFVFVNVRKQDDLPQHVKKSNKLPTTDQRGAIWDPRERIYKAVITYTENLTTSNRIETVEFITDQDGEDDWYRIERKHTENGPAYFTKKIYYIGGPEQGLGWWNNSDQQHPKNRQPQIGRAHV